MTRPAHTVRAMPGSVPVTRPRLLVAVFEKEEDLVAAASACRLRDWTIADAYTPYAVHGLDEAIGLRPSRLPRACLAFGATGFLIAVLFQFWSSAVDWPIDVGGKPWNSWPAFVPVAFEMTILFAGVGTALTFIAISGLRPWRKPSAPVERVTDDRFALVLEETDAAFDAAEAGRFLESHGAISWHEQPGEEVYP